MELLLDELRRFPSPGTLLLLAAALVFPVGLRLAAPGGRPRGRWRLAARLHAPAAIALVGSFAFPRGETAAALVLPWVAFTAVLALLGALRFVERGPAPCEELAIDAALAFPAVGATWLVFSRWGAPLMGFGEPTVLLTAAHFHVAGFALPLLTGLAGRVAPGLHANAAAIGVVTGLPFVAGGITLAAKGYPEAEMHAASWLCAASLAAAALQVRAVGAARSAWPRVVLLVSALCLAGAMALAAAWGARGRFPFAGLDLDAMVRLHATAIVLGFALPALVAWRFGVPAAAPRVRGFDLLVTWLGDEPDLAAWEARSIAAGSEAGPRDGDARDDHEDRAGTEPPGEPAANGPYAHAATVISRYDVFPPNVLLRVSRRAPVQVGDTLGASYDLLAGVRVCFASRVTRTFDERSGAASRTGFTYRTIEGHPFEGEETFAVEKSEGGEVRVSLRSWSRPAAFVARVLWPLVRHLQVQGGKAGLAYLRHGSQW